MGMWDPGAELVPYIDSVLGVCQSGMLRSHYPLVTLATPILHSGCEMMGIGRVEFSPPPEHVLYLQPPSWSIKSPGPGFWP